jgi:hypothetical protein
VTLEMTKRAQMVALPVRSPSLGVRANANGLAPASFLVDLGATRFQAPIISIFEKVWQGVSP